MAYGQIPPRPPAFRSIETTSYSSPGRTFLTTSSVSDHERAKRYARGIHPATYIRCSYCSSSVSGDRVSCTQCGAPISIDK
jgi:hypothetical protein